MSPSHYTLAALALISSARACDVTGTYVDRAGNIATLQLGANGSIAATPYSATRWAHGDLRDFGQAR